MKQFDSPEQLKKWLRAQEIDLSAWGQGDAKTVDHLWREIKAGETAIEVDPPRRVVNVVRILIRRRDRLLIEQRQELHSGQRRTRGRPPSEKMRPGESYEQAALRCLQEELGVPCQETTLVTESYRSRELEAISGSYPGLCTHYTFHILKAQAPCLPDNDFCTVEQGAGPGEAVYKHYWVWRQIKPVGI